LKLSEKLKRGRLSPVSGELRKEAGLGRDAYHKIKAGVHLRLIEKMDLNSIDELSRDILADSVKDALQSIMAGESIPLNQQERAMLVTDVMNEIIGLGPLEPLMRDDTVQDVLVNGYAKVYVEKNGVLYDSPIQFRDNEHLKQIIDKIVAPVGRRIDESSPMVDARLPDGSRVNAVIPPIALDGPILSIRKFGYNPLKAEDVLRNITLTGEMLGYLKAAVRSKLNILISGGTGSGKTTLLNIFSSFIPDSERIITIEDSAELQLQQPHVVRLEARPSNIEGKGEITLANMVKNSLRMRPDRIIVGESRGAEAMDMLQAMNTGHQGSMSTIHANSPRDALARLEVMVSMGTSFFSEKSLRGLVTSAINIVVHLARLPDGTRRTLSVSEITGIEGDIIILQDIFTFEQGGVNNQGKIYGKFNSTGVMSTYFDHMQAYGIKLDPAIFKFQKEV